MIFMLSDAYVNCGVAWGVFSLGLRLLPVSQEKTIFSCQIDNLKKKSR